MEWLLHSLCSALSLRPGYPNPGLNFGQVFKVRGYPELPSNGWIDAAMLYVLLAHGYGQLVLGGGCAVMHQTHPKSYDGEVSDTLIVTRDASHDKQSTTLMLQVFYC